MRRYSLIRRVVAIVLLIELAFAVATTSLVYFYQRHLYLNALDISLRGHADSLMGAVVEKSDDTDSVMMDVAGIQTPKDDLYEVWEKDTLLGSAGSLSAGDPALRSGADGFLKLKADGKRYRAVRLHALRVIDPTTFKVRHELVVLYASPTKGVFDAIERAVRFFAIANGLILLLTGWLVYVLVRRSVSPLRELADDASKIAANSWRFSPSRRSRAIRELEPLVGAMDALIQRLERAFGQQRIFISDAAHELKTSVAVVKSSIQLLTMKERTSAEYHAGLERCQQDCARMEELVRRMLLLATVEEGDQTQRAAGTAQVAEIVVEVAHDLEPIAHLQQVRVVCRGDRALAAIAPGQWKTVCTELVLNAVQHSPKHSAVTVDVTSSGSRITVSVRNDGDTLPSEVLPHLFDRFYRGDTSRTRATGGTGLGLAICKAIVEQAGGSIAVQSSAGVEVLVELPSARA